MATNYKRYLLINLVTVVIILTIVEIAAHIILNKVYNRDFDSSLIVEHKYYASAGLKENANGTVWGKAFNTDNTGCRKAAKSPIAGKKKWLFIGDSVTEGVGVDDSSVFSSVVFENIDSVNIQNYSLIGYSVSDYLNVLKAVLNKNDSSINRATIFFCLNDVYGNVPSNQLPVMTKSNIIGKLNAFLQNHYCTYKLIKLAMFRNSDRYFQYDLQFYNDSNTYFTNAMNILKQCDSVCHLAGVEMNVIVVPYRPQIYGKDKGNSSPQDLIEKFCSQNKIACSDPLEYLSEQPNPGSLYLFADEIHLSEKGHYALARFILSH